MQTKHTLSCDLCKYVAEGASERGVRQGLGVHRRMAHGVLGQRKADSARKVRHTRMALNSRGSAEQRRQWYEHVIAAKEAKAKERANSDLGRPMSLHEVHMLTPEQKKLRTKLRQKAWWERKKSATNGHAKPTLDAPPAAASSTPSVEQVQHCKLSECPVCGSRFYVAKGRSE